MIQKLSRGPCLILLLASPAVADQVILKNGAQLEAEVLERTSESLVLGLDGGRLTLDTSDVEAIRPGPTAFGTYRERARALAPDDAAGWLTLAQWARDQRLARQSQEAFAQVLQLDPDNRVANEAVGNVELAGRWMSREDAYRAQGYVLFEERWLLPAERATVLRERAAAAEAVRIESERREAEARLAEAEVRARAAEARLQEAERRFREAEAIGREGDSSSCCDDARHHDDRRARHRHHAARDHRGAGSARSDSHRERSGRGRAR